MRRRPFARLPWDALSDQPDRIRDPALRRALRAGAWGDWLATAAATAVAAPAALAAALAPPRRPPFAIGVGISPLDQDPLLLRDLLDELGCGHVLVRFEWRRMHRWPELAAALARIGRPALAVLVQDRGAVCDPRRWCAGLARFHALRGPEIEAVQACQAVNRLKWGCATVGESLPLVAEAVRWQRRHAPAVPILGSSTIDFEPLPLVRSLVHGHPLRCDGTAVALYVDRRGGPDGRQYGLDLAGKILVVDALRAASPHGGGRLWITEFNWPLAGHGRHAPTSRTECVDEDAAAAHTAAFLRIARGSGRVGRAYHWQLLAIGYGLVDPRDRRRRPAFHALREAIAAP
ncbi:MAG: hypothetical protein RLZZ127_435 [Planctomycetota bacterium]